ncbi:MAG: hypothetical protein A2V79_00985 [Betaproteobacteria bacterium RBG_16_56_24]|nr:MAG: hypothetical protein A2V79_00985 [Betaproteobacteria bacterium RBG_16_56_24]
MSIRHFFLVGASLLAKFFASKLAPTGGSWPIVFSGIKPESGSIIRRKRRGINPKRFKILSQARREMNFSAPHMFDM